MTRKGMPLNFTRKRKKVPVISSRLELHILTKYDIVREKMPTLELSGSFNAEAYLHSVYIRN